MSESLTIFFDPRFLDHLPADSQHPETPARLTGIVERLNTGILSGKITWKLPRPARRGILHRFHDEAYIMRFEEACLAGKSSLGHYDNQICYDSFHSACLAAGAGIDAIEAIEAGEAQKVFCAVRPPGHHAEAALPLGFCFFNNAALAARHWQEAHGKRVLILDFDAHHGNGIQAAAEMYPRIFYVSIHEHPAYSFPGTGYAEESIVDGPRSRVLDIPLSPSAADDQVLAAMAEKVLPAVEGFAPTGIVIAAGFDGHVLDDMSGLAYSTALYGHLGAMIRKLAARFCDGRVVSFLEGGYHRDALAAGVENYLAGLLGLGMDGKELE